MILSREEVEHVARLARVGMTEDDIEKFGEQLSNILENFEILKQVDTSNVPPSFHSIPLENVLRDDKAAPSFPKEDILANAPRSEEERFRVKVILEEF